MPVRYLPPARHLIVVAGIAAGATAGGCAPSTSRDALSTATSDTVATSVAWPETPSSDVAAAVGLYASGADTLVLLEAEGRLRLLTADSASSPLRTGDSPLSYTVVGHAGDSLRLVLGDSADVTAVRLGGRDYARLHVAPDDGGSFRIVPERPMEELLAEAFAATPPAQPDSLRDPDLVELTKLDRSIKLDIRYATTNNFMGARFYDEPRAFLQRPAAEALVRVNHSLRRFGLGLLVHDAYRPWYVTRMFWDATPANQHDFVADPATGSRHNRGGAVDLTLYDLETGEPVTMPSGYDEFSPRARWDWPGGMARQRALRDLLRRAMESEEFDVYPPEWWHFDHHSWRSYPVLNLPFDALDAGR